MTDATELEAIAIEIAREAGALAKQRRAEGVAIAATKSAIADIVTEADREVEALIRARIAEGRPGDGFLGEESGAEEGTTGVTWVVDPIDGTVNYAHGIPAYAVSIARSAPENGSATRNARKPRSHELPSLGSVASRSASASRPSSRASSASRSRARMRSGALVDRSASHRANVAAVAPLSVYAARRHAPR